MPSIATANSVSAPKPSLPQRLHEVGLSESTCRQYQCRMKRCGQFWSQLGDEALPTLTSFWKSGYWENLFPHAQLTSVSRN